MGVGAILGGQAGSQQADVNDALAAFGDRLRTQQDSAEGRSDAGRWRRGVAVEDGQVGVGVEASQASCPGLDPPRSQAQVAICTAGLVRATGHPQAHAAPHGRESEAALDSGDLGARHGQGWPGDGRSVPPCRVNPGDHPPDCLVRATGAGADGDDDVDVTQRTTTRGAGAASRMTFAPGGAFWPGLRRT